MSADLSPARLAELFGEIDHELSGVDDSNAALDLLAQVAARRVDGAEYAGVTIGRDGREVQHGRGYR